MALISTTKGCKMRLPNGKNQNVLIRFENVTKQFHEGEKDRVVLQGVNAEIARGEFVAIVGRSGSGKSTLLNLLAGLDTPTSGDIFIALPDGAAGAHDTNIAKLNDTARTLFRRKHIGFVFQFFNLIPTLTVRENVLMPAELAGWDDKRARAQADRLLNAIGLAERGNVFPDKLSGGEGVKREM
ncbi:MAG: ATP-binding cassette domain-containing protein [Chloroflexi bacterium]|nr:ATP-binding cassette domain-containing protein [Chloroflexota bacterium]